MICQLATCDDRRIPSLPRHTIITHSVKSRQSVEPVYAISHTWGLHLCRSPRPQEVFRRPCCRCVDWDSAKPVIKNRINYHWLEKLIEDFQMFRTQAPEFTRSEPNREFLGSSFRSPCSQTFLNGLPGAIFQQGDAHLYTDGVTEDFCYHAQILLWLALYLNFCLIEHLCEQPKCQIPPCLSV
ncbi:hypothetical protein TNCV_3740121 [Trichonephila clavipes]|nr:hypothetical protein TNCV_3740121 [Trichonephila clavipes]